VTGVAAVWLGNGWATILLADVRGRRHAAAGSAANPELIITKCRSGGLSMASITYRITLTEPRLAAVKVIIGKSTEEVESKVSAQKRVWSAQIAKLEQRRRAQSVQETSIERDTDAKAAIVSLESFLSAELTKRPAPCVDWDSLKAMDDFRPFTHDLPRVDESSFKAEWVYVPAKSFWERFSRRRRDARLDAEKKQAQAEDDLRERIKAAHEARQKSIDKLRAAYDIEKAAYDEKRRLLSEHIDAQRHDFEKGEADIVESYLENHINALELPSPLVADSKVLVDAGSKTAVVSFMFPAPGAFPQFVGYKYIKSRNAVESIAIKDKDRDALYETALNQTAVLVLYHVFSATKTTPIVDACVFNALVTDIDKSTGKDFTNCVLSVRVERAAFEALNLQRVEPKEFLRSMKALSAGPLVKLAPVRPIMTVDRVDSRFIASKDVLDALDDNANLATMPWEDFEHLVRELFGQIFSKDGAEVRVTQASRDGGVDAIAFDPDPIRGGKFVIQAKRYNIVVPVSAVRDLYGTMINEGAAKGIMVTTSHYGNDSREFAKDKPITLIDGANLVYMLGQYGHNYRIETTRNGGKPL
jgi:restriction system protein